MFGHAHFRVDMRLDEEAVTRFFTANRAVHHRDSPFQGIPGGHPDRDAVDRALEEYRMAATNLPRDDGAIRATHMSLVASLSLVPGLAAYYQRIEAAESARRTSLGRRVADPFDATQMEKMHLVAHGIYVGSYHPACDRELLQRHGVTHICCCIDMQKRFPADFVYCVLAADDRTGYDMTQHLATTFEFIDRAVLAGGGVLIHCGAGISRAPTVAAAYLVRKLGISAEDSLLHVKRARACVMPNIGFKAQLKKYADDLKEARARAEEEVARLRERASASQSAAASTAATPSFPGTPVALGGQEADGRAGHHANDDDDCSSEEVDAETLSKVPGLVPPSPAWDSDSQRVAAAADPVTLIGLLPSAAHGHAGDPWGSTTNTNGNGVTMGSRTTDSLGGTPQSHHRLTGSPVSSCPESLGQRAVAGSPVEDRED